MSNQPDTVTGHSKSAFAWNAGGWLGAQLGSSAWMLLLGIMLLWQDALTGLVCLCGFVLLNAIGFLLWRSRKKLTAYAGIQLFLLATTAIYSATIVTINSRGVPGQQNALGMPSLLESFWGIGLPPALMLFMFLREWEAKRNQG